MGSNCWPEPGPSLSSKRLLRALCGLDEIGVLEVEKKLLLETSDLIDKRSAPISPVVPIAVEERAAIPAAVVVNVVEAVELGIVGLQTGIEFKRIIG